VDIEKRDAKDQPNFPLDILPEMVDLTAMDAFLEPIPIPTDLPDKPRRRKLTLDDAKAIAKLVARRKLNESEACHVLGILPAQWQVFKCRNKAGAMFESIITRTKGLTINHAMERLEKAGEDQDITLPNGKVITKRGDWRADAARLPLLDPARFGQQPGQQQASSSVSVDTLAKALQVALSRQTETSQVIDAVEVKQVGNGQDEAK
jgi:hypothetical protein